MHWELFDQLWPAESTQKSMWIHKGEKGRNSQKGIKIQMKTE